MHRLSRRTTTISRTLASGSSTTLARARTTCIASTEIPTSMPPWITSVRIVFVCSFHGLTDCTLLLSFEQTTTWLVAIDLATSPSRSSALLLWLPRIASACLPSSSTTRRSSSLFLTALCALPPSSCAVCTSPRDHTLTLVKVAVVWTFPRVLILVSTFSLFFSRSLIGCQ
jgi:hypothetical protein